MNRLSTFSTAILILLCTTLANSQTTDPIEDDIVKINTSVVQLDAVVTDKDGNPVFDLTRDDFDVFQDGKRKDISSFTFVDTSVSSEKAATERKVDKNSPIAPIRQKANSTGRVITFVVDDGNCTSSLAGMGAARRALEDFISKQMFPTDLVAIYRTRSGSGLLQQYTSDKSQLLKVAKKIRWLPSLGCSSNGDIFEAVRQNYSANPNGDQVDPNDPNNDGLTPDERDRRQKQEIEDRNRDNQIVGTLGVIRYLVKGLDRIRGRKVVFLLSDGLPTKDERGNSGEAFNALRNLAEVANRSAVVLNTVDVRGVVNPLFLSAADDINPTSDFGLNNSSTEAVSNRREEQFRDSQTGLEFLADQTGGNFYRGNNDLSVLVGRALNIEKGYYLLGYEPDEETFRGTKFHTIEIKLKRPGLTVYSRNGFVGRADSVKPKSRSENGELYEAIFAPLPTAGLDLRLTAFFGNSASEGNFVRSLIHIDGKNINFSDDKNGMRKAAFDVVAVTLNEKNEVVDEFTRTHTVRIQKQGEQFVRENGLAYTTDVKVKKPGVYNFRVAMRDTNSGLLGSATQIVEIPNMRDGNIYISGLTIGESNENGVYDTPDGKTPETAISLVRSTGTPEVRSFRIGTRVGYSYTIYNAKVNSKSKAPSISIGLNLYKNGELFIKGEPKIAEFGAQNDWSRIKLDGAIRLNQGIESADYALQIVAKDLIGNKISSQWVDFEVLD